jgi:hypothetical protein
MSQETGLHDMVLDLLNGVKVFKVEYSKVHHTFIVTWGPAGASEPHNRSTLNRLHFPDHKPLKFMDEYVRIGDEVMVWLKDESSLKEEGWQEYRDGRRLRSESSPFFIGKEKRRLLGTGMTCKIGVTEKLQVYAYYKDYRFSPAEVKTVLKLDFVEPMTFAEVATEDGYFSYKPSNNKITLPDGNEVPAKWVKGINEVYKQASR